MTHVYIQREAQARKEGRTRDGQPGQGTATSVIIRKQAVQTALKTGEH